MPVKVPLHTGCRFVSKTVTTPPGPVTATVYSAEPGTVVSISQAIPVNELCHAGSLLGSE